MNNKNNQPKNTNKKDILFIEHLQCTTACWFVTLLSPTLSIQYFILFKAILWWQVYPTSGGISDQGT